MTLGKLVYKRLAGDYVTLGDPGSKTYYAFMLSSAAMGMCAFLEEFKTLVKDLKGLSIAKKILGEERKDEEYQTFCREFY